MSLLVMWTVGLSELSVLNSTKLSGAANMSGGKGYVIQRNLDRFER